MNGPATPQSFFRQAVYAYQMGDLEGAAKFCADAMAADPQHFDSLHLSAVVASQRGDPERGIALLTQSLALAPTDKTRADVLANRAFTFQNVGRYAEALADAEAAIALEPRQAVFHLHRGTALQRLGRGAEAAAAYDEALALDPRNVDALYERGVVFMEQRQPAEALERFGLAVQLEPNYCFPLNGMGLALDKLGRGHEALAAFDAAIRADPKFASAYINRAVSLNAMGHKDEALATLDRAIVLAPNNANAHGNRSTLLAELGRKVEAFESLQNALKINADFPFGRGMRLHYKMYVCDWSDHATELADLLARVERGERVSQPSPLLGLTDDPLLQRKAAAQWMELHHPENPALGPLIRYPRHDRIRVGYYSADFHAHATAHLMAELFECHDRTEFEVTAFSFGRMTGDAMQQRLKAGAEHFIDVRNMTDQDVAALSRKHEIDIALDVKGFTEGYRAGIFAHRAAPVQALYLAYPGTMAAAYYDYNIADSTIVPEAHFPFFSEKIIQLPHSYQVNDRKRKAAAHVPTKAELGLPADGFVFCSFNNNFKITPDVFDAWMRILKAVPDSVLWLIEDSTLASTNLRKEAQKRDVDPGRLIFCGRVAPADHLARHAAADLFLDTFPCNAHTTASDALWMGVPLLTYMGKSFVARVAGSLLKAVNLPELIVEDLPAYEALAISLGKNPARVQAMKDKLVRERMTSPLFDTPRYTRDLEAAYHRMYEDSRDV